MKIFEINKDLYIEADADCFEPVLRLVDRAGAEGGDPLRVIVYPHEIKALVVALIPAAIWVTCKWIKNMSKRED